MQRIPCYSHHSLLVHSGQYIHLHWGPTSGSPQTTPNLYLEEAIAAARRGVKVRILLSDAFLDPRDPKDNTHTVTYVNDIARREKLDMEARVIDGQRAALDKIHNKGVLVDGRKVLVSSVNWSLNSPLNNREVSLVLDSLDLGAYFTDMLTSVTRDTQNYGGLTARFSQIRRFFVSEKPVDQNTEQTTALRQGQWSVLCYAGSGGGGLVSERRYGLGENHH